MTDLSFLLCFQCCIIQSAFISRSWTECRIMELIDINIITAKILKALFKILTQSFSCLCPCFGGDIKALSFLFKSKTYLVFTVTVGSCRIKEPDPAIIGFVQEGCCSLITDPLDRKRSESILVYHYFCFSQSYLYHDILPFIHVPRWIFWGTSVHRYRIPYTGHRESLR